MEFLFLFFVFFLPYGAEEYPWAQPLSMYYRLLRTDYYANRPSVPRTEQRLSPDEPSLKIKIN